MSDTMLRLPAVRVHAGLFSPTRAVNILNKTRATLCSQSAYLGGAHTLSDGWETATTYPIGDAPCSGF